MFDFLEGRIESLRPGEAVVRTGGVGWKLHATSRALGRLQEGRRGRLYVHLAVSESALTLYGFSDETERALFSKLLQVSGVGPSSALGVLSAMEPGELIDAILSGDTGRMTAVKGIGKKTADRLVVELRDRLTEFPARAGRESAEAGPDELSRVLLDLGFRPAEARSAAQAAREALGAEAQIEELLRQALRGNG